MNEEPVLAGEVFPDVSSIKPVTNPALQTAVELVNVQKRLGLSLTMFDKNLHKISGKFNSMADLLRNPDFYFTSESGALR